MNDFKGIGQQLLLGMHRRGGKIMLALEQERAGLRVLGVSDTQIEQLEKDLFDKAITTLHQNNVYVLNGLNYCYGLLAQGIEVDAALVDTRQTYIEQR